MSQSFSLLSLSSIVSIFVVLNSFHDGVNGDLIRDVCKNASTTDPNIKYDFCVASLSAYPASKNAHDLLELGIISMKTCLWKATSIRSYIAKILKGGKGESAAKPSLEECLNLYSDAIRSVQKSVASLKIKDYGSANIQMSAAMDASTSCEDGFKEVVAGQDLTSSLAKQDSDFFQLAGISLAIIHMV